MRLAFHNLIDDLNASTLSALSETTGYEVTQVQDQRLTTTWKSSSATSQTVLATLPTLPEYPDNVTGTTYIQDAWATVDGWTVLPTYGTASVAGGRLRIVSASSGIETRIDKTVTHTGLTIKLKVYSDVNISQVQYYNGVSYVDMALIAGNGFSYANVLASSSSASLTLKVITSSASSYIDFDWIYIGNGNYDTQLTDLSGNANHATIYGATPVDTPYGRGLSGDGVNDYVEIPYTLQSSAYALGCYLKLNTGSLTQDIMYLMGSPIAICLFRVDTSNRINAVWNDNTGTPRTFVGPTLTVGVEYIVFVLFTGNEILIYLNGVLSASSTLNATITNSTPIRIRLFANGNVLANYFNGIIAQPRIYNRALSADEVLNLYNQTPFTTENDSLAGFWDVDHGLGIDTVAIGGHNIKTGTQVKIQASNTNEWSNPEINETLTVNPDLIVKFLSSKKFYKYWRFLFGSQGDLEIGRLWLGEYLQISPSSLNGFSVVKKRSDNVIHGKNRQKWAVPGIGWRRFELSFPRTAEAMIYQLSQMYDDVGNHSSMIFCNFDDLVNYELVRPCYVSIDGEVGFTHTKRQKYEWLLNLEEEK